MSSICAACKNCFEIVAEDLVFYNKISPVISGTRFEIPAPSLCPDCRLQRRNSWRNEYRYYSRKCSSCQCSIVSVHAEDQPYPVYCNRCWWGDNWDPLAYGIDYDPEQSFIAQCKALQRRVPQLTMMNDNGVGSENCEYTNDFAFGKNCYLFTGSWQAQDSFYSSCCNHVRDICDCDCVNLHSELVYQSVDSQQLYRCSYLQSSDGCSDCHFGIDLKGCTHCVGCVGLRRAKFQILNQPFTETEFKLELARLDLSSQSGLQKFQAEFAAFAKDIPRKTQQQVSCEDTRGYNLSNCRNFFGFDTFHGEHSKYFVKGDSPQFCYDIQNSGNPLWCYECITPDNSYLVAFSLWCWKCKNVLYSDNCHSSENLFGCVALKRAKYCILNTQYSQSEYEALVPRIIEKMCQDKEWGEFFPMAESPFAYNESLAYEMFPRTEQETIDMQCRWKVPSARVFQLATITPPDSIDGTDATIIKELLACVNCRKNYRILPLEFAFYQKMRLPVPHHCSDCRRNLRQKLRVPYTFRLQLRTCFTCKQTVETALTEQMARNVICMECHARQTY